MIGLWLLLVGVAIFGAASALDTLFGATQSTLAVLTSFNGLAFATGLSVVYLLIRKNIA